MSTHLLPTRTREAYDAIKRRVIELDLPPGAAFTEGELAASLGLSKTPVREALLRLRQEGLVDAAARCGYRVTPVTIKRARDLFQLRALLEVEAAGSAAERRLDLDALIELEQLGRQTYDAGDRASITRFMEENTRFHVALAELGGNEALADMLQYVLEQLERLFHLGLVLRSRGDEIVHEHQELLAAVKAGNGRAARRIAGEQAASSQLMVLNALLSSEAVMSADSGISAAK
ncbi:MAG: GntR family transcriptional regulator [Actinobacteria bacterium]|nr:GntR family transcriptional regulator [Actinomycetota bacterium]